MDTSSVDFFWSEVKQGIGAKRLGHYSASPSVRAASWAEESRDFHSPHDTTPSLDLDALKLALTHLDHSLQKGKAFVGRSGALSNRRPPSRESRSSRRSSTDSLQLLQDQADLEEDLVIPRVVNIEVQVESDSKDSKNRDHQKSSEKPINCVRNRDFTFREQLQEPKLYRTKEKRKGLDSFSANQEIRKKLFETRNKKTFGGSNPLLSSTHESEESFRRIKEEVSRLAAKRRSSSDITELWPPSDVTSNTSVTDSQRSEAARKWNEERESLLESASTIFEREGDDNRSSSEADFVISDRESIADSGLVNRRTVIKISEKKSKSATNLISENPVPLWIRDLQTRRSLRSGKDQSTARVIPIEVDPAFEGGINVSIVNQPEPPRKESTSRMYVRQSDSENRPSRASAFNVRRTIEKRQIQQERRERRALREQIKEQLRSLSEERQRRDSSSSHVSSTHISQNSVRSKSMSSLDQDQDDFRSESPLFKVQSSPTLEKEKEGIRSYLFGVSNLTESGPPSHDMSPTSREVNVTEEDISDTENICESLKSEQNNPQDSEKSSIWERIKSCDPLEIENTKNTRKSQVSNRSNDSLEGTSTHSQQNTNTGSSLHQISTEDTIRSPSCYKREKLISTPTKYKSDDTSDISNLENTVQQNLTETVSTKRDSFTLPKEEDQSETRPIPPPRKHRLSLSAGHITLEGEEKPNWIRLAKERRSLRSAKPVDQLSDRASSTCQEPEWVAKARRKLEALNVTLTSTTDFNSVSSHITESSSAWSRGGLDALDDLREETSRIGVELAEEASARVNEDLSATKITNKMLEHNTDRSRDQSAERPRVSFDSSAVETSDGESSRRYRSRKPQKDEVRFGDLKHDWGGVQSKSLKATAGKTKEMRFGETPTKDSVCESPPERTKELRFGDHMKGSSVQKCHSNPTSPNGNLPVMRFGDTPLNLFPDSQAKKVQSSSKFESVAGPDPTKMTAEQLNQNVEEYDFPIPTGKEDVTEFMKFLEDSLKKVEIVPEVVCSEEPKPKPKSILKRRSVENVFLELKKEEKNEFHQKVEHRKSASFDWDTVGKGGDASLDTGHLRNNGIKLSTEHFNQHAEVSNRVKRSPQHNSSTSTSIATNSSFFNVKLRHVASNKHELAVTKDSHRFHTEHNPLKRPQGLNTNTSKHNEDFSSVNSFSNGREAKISNTGVSKGTEWHGASSSQAASKENISDFGSYSEADYISNENPRDNHQQSLEEYKMIVRKISKKELPVDGVENGIHVSRWPPETPERPKENKKQGYAASTPHSEEGTTVQGRTVQDLLQKVQEPPAAWGTCRAGRGLDATALVRTTLLTRLTNRPSPAWLH